MRILSRTYEMIFYAVKRVFFLLEFFLFIRLMLKFLEANSQTLVVNLIYKYSDILVSPFESIFPNIHWPEGYLIDTTTLSAMIGYTILVFIIFQLLRLFSSD